MIADEILKTALLGTDKYMPNAIPGLESLTGKIAQQTTEKEDKFLKIAAATLLFEEAGALPGTTEISMPECPPETQDIINEKLAGYLETFLQSKDDTLLRYFIFVCNKRKLVVTPELVPLVLNKALEHKISAQPLVNICGETGRWLGKLNEQWTQFYTAANDEENIWETGNAEQRKQYFAAFRKTNPIEALQLLESVFTQENAALRLEFVELLQDQLSTHDEPFLQSLSKDKSQKVKDAAIELLKMIQGSAINQMYLDFVLKTIVVTDKQLLHIDETTVPDEAIFKSGIDKVSAQKGVKDHSYWLGQMLACIDPKTLSEKLGIADEALLSHLLEYKESGALQPYLIRAAVSFKNKSWALHFLKPGNAGNIYLLDVLEPAERAGYYKNFLLPSVGTLINYILDDSYTPVSQSLAEMLLDQLSKAPYQIQGPDYQRLALFLPIGITDRLKSYQQDVRTEYQVNYFRNQATEMLRILDIKNNIQ